MEQKSVVKLLQTKESLYVFDAAAEKDILSAEKALALRFAADYREYVSAFGAASYCEHELTGICQSARLNVVDVTQDERQYNSVPADWYVIEEANIDGIVMWQATDGTVYRTCPGSKADKICDSLEEYISLE